MPRRDQTTQEPGGCNVKPGDFIEWVHEGIKCDPEETLWSSIEEAYVPIGLLSVLLWIKPSEYAWLTSRGVYRAQFSDIEDGSGLKYGRVYPRQIR